LRRARASGRTGAGSDEAGAAALSRRKATKAGDVAARSVRGWSGEAPGGASPGAARRNRLVQTCRPHRRARRRRAPARRRGAAWGAPSSRQSSWGAGKDSTARRGRTSHALQGTAPAGAARQRARARGPRRRGGAEGRAGVGWLVGVRNLFEGPLLRVRDRLPREAANEERRRAVPARPELRAARAPWRSARGGTPRAERRPASLPRYRTGRTAPRPCAGPWSHSRNTTARTRVSGIGFGFRASPRAGGGAGSTGTAVGCAVRSA
jgi:hypothetical protein